MVQKWSTLKIEFGFSKRFRPCTNLPIFCLEVGTVPMVFFGNRRWNLKFQSSHGRGFLILHIYIYRYICLCRFVSVYTYFYIYICVSVHKYIPPLFVYNHPKNTSKDKTTSYFCLWLSIMSYFLKNRHRNWTNISWRHFWPWHVLRYV